MAVRGRSLLDESAGHRSRVLSLRPSAGWLHQKHWGVGASLGVTREYQTETVELGEGRESTRADPLVVVAVGLPILAGCFGASADEIAGAASSAPLVELLPSSPAAKKFLVRARTLHQGTDKPVTTPGLNV